jgi:hypothetical protein
MLILVWLSGLLILVLGVLILIRPKKLEEMATFLGEGKKFYLVGILRILMGIVFFLASSQCRWPEVIIAMGLIILVKGILIFACGIGAVKAFLGWWTSKPPFLIRLVGLIVVAFAALLFYAA